MEDEKQITVSGMLQHLKDGMSRKEIAAHYGITQAECKIHFQHPLLKNKKTIKTPVLTYTLVDDVTPKAANVVVEAADNAGEGIDDQTENNNAAPSEVKKKVVVGKGEDKVEPKEETPVEKATWG